MKKILVAVDGSESSLKAVDYISDHFSMVRDLTITILHVLPYAPSVFWDDGHILTQDERKARKDVVERWLSNQQLRIEPIFRSAIERLMRGGMREEQIETKVISDSTDVAESILEESKIGSYRTLVVGRRGFSQAKRFFMGSVTNKIINHGAGMAICIVE